jgi:hypothetical protein
MRQVISPSAAGSACFWCGNIDRRPPPRKGRNDTRNRGSDRRVVIPSVMEDSMCWEMDYRWLAEQKKAEETKAKQQQRSEAIEKLLSEANKPTDKPEETAPVREIIPAK